MSKSLEHHIIACARELISDPKHWTTGPKAKNHRGRRVTPDDPKATKFCAYGAILKTVYELGLQSIDEENKLLERCADSIPPCGGLEGFTRLIHTNEHAGHSEVLALLDQTLHSM